METVAHHKPKFWVLVEICVDEVECLFSNEFIVAVDVDHELIVSAILLDELCFHLQETLFVGFVPILNGSYFLSFLLKMIIDL